MILKGGLTSLAIFALSAVSTQARVASDGYHSAVHDIAHDRLDVAALGAVNNAAVGSSSSGAGAANAPSSTAAPAAAAAGASSGSGRSQWAQATSTAAGSPSSAAGSMPASSPSSVAIAPGPGGNPLPLTQYTYAYSAIPERVNPYAFGRGPQSGYNLCNSTTQGGNSECQTLIVNSIKDFCLWGSPDESGYLGSIEASTVAYCVLNTHGARPIPPGTFTGVQFLKSSAYIQITGHLNVTGLGYASDDSGGELDPHGADLLGNPLGGLVYSSSFNSADGQNLEQAFNWNMFVGNGVFCLKICDPKANGPDYCNNLYDVLGCDYNMPNSYRDNEFTSCDSDLQDVVGVYTNSAGQTVTWSQPSVLPSTSTLPYTPRIPSSSNCKTYQSTDLFGTLPTPSSSSSRAATAIDTVTTQDNAGNAVTTELPHSIAKQNNKSKTSGATSGRTAIVIAFSSLFTGFIGLVSLVVILI